MLHSRQEGIDTIDSLDPGLRRDDRRGLRLSLCLFVERVLTAAAAVLHELKAYFRELLFILVCMVCNFFTLCTLKFCKVVLGHIVKLLKMCNVQRN